MPKILLTKSSKEDKKYMVILPSGKKIHFGQKNASDFTKHKDEERKERYIARHEKREDWNDMETAGFWSKHILWNKPTLRESIKDTNKKFNIHIIKVRKVDERS